MMKPTSKTGMATRNPVGLARGRLMPKLRMGWWASDWAPRTFEDLSEDGSQPHDCGYETQGAGHPLFNGFEHLLRGMPAAMPT